MFVKNIKLLKKEILFLKVQFIRCTEEICAKELEKKKFLKSGVDFLSYSERVNPVTKKEQ